MKIKVLASSSTGNCYLLQNGKEILILECGINYKDILKGLNFSLKNVIGCLVSHIHKDHSKAVGDLIKNGIDVYTSKGTIEAMGLNSHRLRVIKSEEQFTVGGFTILPFETQHDAPESLGFLIQYKDIKILFITDSYYCQYKFSGINTIMVECNYSSEILLENIEQGLIPNSLRDRLLKSHFSLANVKEFLKVNDLSKVENIMLIHLSDGNSNAELFQSEIERLTGKPVYVAEKDLEIELF